MESVRFDKAGIMTLDNSDYLTLRLPNVTEKHKAGKFIGEMPDAMHIADLKRHREKRSNDANSYCWKLISELASILNRDPVLIYRDYVQEIGKYEQYLMTEDAYETFEKAWCGNHIGRIAMKIGWSREKKGYIWVAAYLGSSDFDTHEMYRMLQNIRQDCQEQGIAYLTPDEEKEILSRWESGEGH